MRYWLKQWIEFTSVPIIALPNLSDLLSQSRTLICTNIYSVLPILVRMFSVWIVALCYLGYQVPLRLVITGLVLIGNCCVAGWVFGLSILFTSSGRALMKCFSFRMI